MTGTALQALDELARGQAESGVTSPTVSDARMTWMGTSLGIAGVPLLVGEGELQEIIETPPVTAIPGTKPWVMGVAAYMGGLLPIISGDVFFRGRPYVGRVREFCMIIRRPGFYFGITLSDIERDIKFPVEERDMEYPVDPDFAEFPLGGFHSGDRFLAILDVDKLVADSELANAAASRTAANEEISDEQ